MRVKGKNLKSKNLPFMVQGSKTSSLKVEHGEFHSLRSVCEGMIRDVAGMIPVVG